MSPTPNKFKTPKKAKQFMSPTSTLEPRISESSTNNNKPPQTPQKPPRSRVERPSGSRARRKLNFEKLPAISEIAQQANREMSSANRVRVSQNLNGKLLPPNVMGLFRDIDSQITQLDPGSRVTLRRAHSMANSVQSLTNNDPNKISTMYNVENDLIQLKGDLEAKQYGRAHD